jgi:hypothetical protein
MDCRETSAHCFHIYRCDLSLINAKDLGFSVLNITINGFHVWNPLGHAPQLIVLLSHKPKTFSINLFFQHYDDKRKHTLVLKSRHKGKGSSSLVLVGMVKWSSISGSSIMLKSTEETRNPSAAKLGSAWENQTTPFSCIAGNHRGENKHQNLSKLPMHSCSYTSDSGNKNP